MTGGSGSDSPGGSSRRRLLAMLITLILLAMITGLAAGLAASLAHLEQTSQQHSPLKTDPEG
jgi:hypothetical protein